jgi:hypothetical protein
MEDGVIVFPKKMETYRNLDATKGGLEKRHSSAMAI